MFLTITYQLNRGTVIVHFNRYIKNCGAGDTLVSQAKLEMRQGRRHIKVRGQYTGQVRAKKIDRSGKVKCKAICRAGKEIGNG